MPELNWNQKDVEVTFGKPDYDALRTILAQDAVVDAAVKWAVTVPNSDAAHEAEAALAAAVGWYRETLTR